MRSAPASRYSRWMRLTTSGRERLRTSTLFLSSLGCSRNRSPRQSSSLRPCLCKSTPVDPSKITIRCLNSRSRRSRVEDPAEVAVAMWTLKSTEDRVRAVQLGLLDRVEPPNLTPAILDRGCALDLCQEGDDCRPSAGGTDHDSARHTGPLEVGDELVMHLGGHRHGLAGVEGVEQGLYEGGGWRRV